MSGNCLEHRISLHVPATSHSQKARKRAPKKRSPTRIAGQCRQVGALRPPALSCTVFQPLGSHPNTEQSPACISGLTAIPIGTPAKARTRRFKPVEGVRMPARRQNAPRGAQRANRALSGRSHLRRFHRCDLRFHLCRKLQQRLPVFFSAVLAHLVQDRTFFSSTLSW